MRRALARAAGVVVLACAAVPAQAQWRFATWNITDFNGGRSAAIQTAVYDSFQGRRFAPDVLCVQEVESASAASSLLLTLNTDPDGPGDWALAAFINGPDTESILLYRTSKAVLVRNTTIVARADGTTADQPRHTYRWDLRPVGYGATPGVTIGVYGTHMKSNDTAADQARRLIEATDIRDNAEGIDTEGPGTGLPAGYAFLLMGDFNIQTASQAAYVELTGSQANNTGRFFDPIRQAGGWNNSSTYRMIHTQDPVGAGGMDDRLDQILLGPTLLDQAGLDYIGTLLGPQNPIAWNLNTFQDPNHSYRCWGNDGTSYNEALNISANAMVGPVIAQALVDVTGGTSGHLPVFLDLRVPAKAATTASLDFGTVAQGSSAPARTLTVTNSGDVNLWTTAGIATLTYSMAASPGFSAPGGAFSEPPGGGSNSHTISMSTATAGPKVGSVVLTTNDPDRPTIIVTLTGVVTPPNVNPVARAGDDQVVADADGSGSEIVFVDGSASTDSDGTIVEFRWSEGSTVLAQGPSAMANFPLSVGVHTLTLLVTDDDGGSDTDEVVVEVLPGCDPDFNRDGNVDQDDVSCLAQAVAGDPTCSDADPDFNRDGNVDQDDIEALTQAVAGAGCP
ncbi:MAG: choice-of-anchor D domain-containing protein [Planctomycetota bacterium]|nr:choice-of-anchor D domain-containing protein [Planctomycetota bacterium]